VLLRGERNPGRGLARLRRLILSAPRGLGLVLTIVLFAAVALFGALRGGEYQAFIAREGDLRDVVARALGFDIAIVTISGQVELRELELLAAARITPKNSLLFLDAAEARKGLEALPLVKSASVRKLYPNHLVIDLVERAPYALWQKDGQVSIVAADGAPIDEMTDDRFIGLPFVVGDGANERLPEFMALLDAAAELRPKIRAGVLVSGRRWDLTMTNGMVVKLPEVNPQAAMATLVRLQRQDRVLERAALSLDLRAPGKMFVRLTEEAAAARAAAMKPAKKGAT
jgi:cell division protein FtsQ